MTNETELTNRALDRQVAEKMGLKVSFHYLENWPYCDCKELMYQTETGFEVVPDYSASETTAAQLVKYATDKHKNLYFELARRTNGTWVANFEYEPANPEDTSEYYAYGDTHAEAVCKAFLTLDLSLAGED